MTKNGRPSALCAIAFCSLVTWVANAQDLKKSVQTSGVETTAAVANSTNSSKIDTYASAVITDYIKIYDGYWAAIQLDVFDNGNWIDENVSDDGMISAKTSLSDPINLGHQYDVVATSDVCWWVDEGDGFGYEDCYYPYWYQLDIYGVLGTPQISSISPSGGTIGKSGSITVQGQNLVDPFSGQASAAITGSGVTLTVQNNPSDTQVGLNYSIAQNATVGNQSLTLSNRFGSSNSATFTVGYPPAVVTNISPSVWTAGQSTSVTITGTGFGNQPTTSVNGTGVSLMLNSASPDGTTIQATATVNLVAPSQSVTVTVQPGYAGQGFYCNCPPGQEIGTNTATIQPVTPAPQIMFNGQNISGTTQTVMAGQKIVLSVTAPSPYSIQPGSESWSFSNQSAITGGFVNGAGTPGTQPSAAAGGSEAADPLLNQNSLTFYWVNPGDNGETVTCTYTLNNGQQASATATFNVGGPTDNVWPNSFAQSDVTGALLSNAQNASAKITMSNAPGKNSVGIWFNDNATLPSGKLIWVQILDSVTYSQLVQSGNTYTPSNALSQIDGIYPYFNGTQNTTWDSPARNLYSYFGEGAISFGATMYVLWDPALPVGCVPAWTDTAVLPGNPYIPHASTCTSTPIPLGSVRWNWSVCDINALAAAPGGGTTPSWFTECSAGSGSTTGTGSGYPHWSSGTGPGGCYVSANANCQ